MLLKDPLELGCIGHVQGMKGLLETDEIHWQKPVYCRSQPGMECISTKSPELSGREAKHRNTVGKLSQACCFQHLHVQLFEISVYRHVQSSFCAAFLGIYKQQQMSGVCCRAAVGNLFGSKLEWPRSGLRVASTRNQLMLLLSLIPSTQLKCGKFPFPQSH